MHTRHIMSAARTCKSLRFAIFSALACGCSTTWGAGGAHEHGTAELLLSSEGRDVQINFNAPAQSLVGFETAAVTAEQRAAVERAEAILMAPSDLFVLEGNSCELIGATIDVTSITDVRSVPSEPEDQAAEHTDHIDEDADQLEEHAEHAEEHANERANHEEDHASTSDNPEHEHHDHDYGDDAPAAESHSDVSATYTFECESDEALTQIAFQRGALPFGLERIEVLWIADWGQGAGQATPQSPKVNLRN